MKTFSSGNKQPEKMTRFRISSKVSPCSWANSIKQTYNCNNFSSYNQYALVLKIID
jgi:hypothetical protein